MTGNGTSAGMAPSGVPGWQQYNAQNPASGSTPMGSPGFGQPQTGYGLPQGQSGPPPGMFGPGPQLAGPPGMFGPGQGNGGNPGYGMGQMPPRQGMGGPMGPPMTDPNSAGGFFRHPGMGFRGGNFRQ